MHTVEQTDKQLFSQVLDLIGVEYTTYSAWYEDRQKKFLSLLSQQAVVDECRQQYMRKQAITVFELTKGFTERERKSLGTSFHAMEEMAGYVLELTNHLPQPPKTK